MSRAVYTSGQFVAPQWVRDSLFSIIEAGPRRSKQANSGGIGGLDAHTLSDIGLEDHRMVHASRDGMIDRCWF